MDFIQNGFSPGHPGPRRVSFSRKLQTRLQRHQRHDRTALLPAFIGRHDAFHQGEHCEEQLRQLIHSCPPLVLHGETSPLLPPHSSALLETTREKTNVDLGKGERAAGAGIAGGMAWCWNSAQAQLCIQREAQFTPLPPSRARLSIYAVGRAAGIAGGAEAKPVGLDSSSHPGNAPQHRNVLSRGAWPTTHPQKCALCRRWSICRLHSDSLTPPPPSLCLPHSSTPVHPMPRLHRQHLLLPRRSTSSTTSATLGADTRPSAT